MEPKIWDFWSNVLLVLLSSSKSTESSICCQRRRKTISVVCKCVLRIVWLTKTDFPVQQEGRESLCCSSDDLFVQRPSSKCTTHKSIKIFIEQFLKILYVVCVFLPLMQTMPSIFQKSVTKNIQWLKTNTTACVDEKLEICMPNDFSGTSSHCFCFSSEVSEGLPS